MKGTKAASRYAKSILTLAIEQNVLEEVNNDMHLIALTCNENHDLVVLLKSPVIKTDKKAAILKAIFENKISKLTLAFLNIITNKKREGLISYIAESFKAQYNEHKNIISAKVSTTFPLDKSLKEKVMAIVKGNTDGDVELIEEVNKDLIGGFVLRIGDKQIDSSIQKKLLNHIFFCFYICYIIIFILIIKICI